MIQSVRRHWMCVCSSIRCSFTVYPIGKGRYMVQSVPGELSLQETSVLSAAADRPDGKVSKSMLMTTLGCVLAHGIPTARI